MPVSSPTPWAPPPSPRSPEAGPDPAAGVSDWAALTPHAESLAEGFGDTMGSLVPGGGGAVCALLGAREGCAGVEVARG